MADLQQGCLFSLIPVGGNAKEEAGRDSRWLPGLLGLPVAGSQALWEAAGWAPAGSEFKACSECNPNRWTTGREYLEVHPLQGGVSIMSLLFIYFSILISETIVAILLSQYRKQIRGWSLEASLRRSLHCTSEI